MAHRWQNDLTHSDITPEPLFWNRRKISGAFDHMVVHF